MRLLDAMPFHIINYNTYFVLLSYKRMRTLQMETEYFPIVPYS